MAENKFYQVTKEINGVTYIAQFNGLRAAMRAQAQCRDEKVPSMQNTEKLADYILANVIVEPHGLTIDDFDSFEELNPVVAFGAQVLNGNFRGEKDTGAAAKNSKK